MAISRMQEPRQLYGLGSLVKKITRPIKKIVKSPIGKGLKITRWHGCLFCTFFFISMLNLVLAECKGLLGFIKIYENARLGRSLGAMAKGLGGAKGICVCVCVVCVSRFV